MKLLDKRTIDAGLANERKSEIDRGLALARRVDTLREKQVTEEENLKKYRTTAFMQVQYEIGQLIETKENLEKQCSDARELRTELLKPLDEEWMKIDLAKNQIDAGFKDLKDRLSDVEKKQTKISLHKDKISEILKKTSQHEKETNQARLDTALLKEMAQKEYESAKGEHDGQTDAYERKIQEIQELQKSYEVGIQTNEIKERILNQKESELIKREKELERQNRLLEITRQVLKT